MVLAELHLAAMPDTLKAVPAPAIAQLRRAPQHAGRGGGSRLWPLLVLALGCQAAVQSGTEDRNAGGSPGSGGSPLGTAGSAGTIAGPAVGGAVPVPCPEDAPPPAPLRRLTRWEYDNTVFDLLGDASHPGAAFVPEAAQFGFDNSAAGAVLSPVVVDQFEGAAKEIAARAAANLPALLGCDVTAQGEDVCAHQFIDRFFRRAYRRELTAGERQRLRTFYQKTKLDIDFKAAITMLVSGALQSPKFLYRIELGMPAPGATTAVPLSPWELASRLSYLLVGSMPDDELMNAAERNLLSRPEQLQQHAKRLLDSERGARVVRNFHRQWVGLEQVEALERIGAGFSASTPALLAQETETFVDQVVRKGDGTLGTLLTAPYSFMNQELASYYGLSGPAGDVWTRVDLDPTRYSGFLTHAGLMARLAHDNQPSPVERGVFLREQLLCTDIPPPPPDLNPFLPMPDPSATARQQLTQKTSVQPCASCHALFNPIGFAFEHFDQMGRYRATDGVLPVDSSGELTGTDADGPYADHMGLAKLLAKSEQVRSCVVLNWFRYAYGRDETPGDACSKRELGQAFSLSGGNIKELILSLTQTRAFRYRDAIQSGALP